jgi:hypothetical protein
MSWLLQLFLLLDIQPRTETCMATVFGYPGDKHGGRTSTLLYDRPVEPGDMGIAHRTWPIGTFIKITNVETKEAAFGVVLDRGPYGKVGPKGKWFNSRKERKRKGKYRGCADVTPDLAAAIGHEGRTRVRIKRWKRVRK